MQSLQQHLICAKSNYKKRGMSNVSKTFLPANILMPQVDSMKKWAVIACDQFSSQPEYWDEVKKYVGKEPSTLHLMLPEADLGSEEEDDKIRKIQSTMKNYVDNHLLKTYENSFVYVERTLQNGKIRRGIVGAIDLEQYSYTPEQEAKIRSTEKTVMERIPPRMKIRYHAPIELPHVILLCDDWKNELLEMITKQKEDLTKLYEFDLMQEGGHIAGWLVDGEVKDQFLEKLQAYEALMEEKYKELSDTPMIYAVGDGNHSLATAKACYEKLKQNHQWEHIKDHPARYALVELENLHDDSQQFEPIHRIITGTEPEELLAALKKECCSGEGQQIRCYYGDKEEILHLDLHKHQLAVDKVQTFLDEYLKENSGYIDYIHGEDVLKNLATQEGALGIEFPAMEKDQLFPSVMTDGTLPRKTFSMGHANEKRYYIEGTKIQK